MVIDLKFCRFDNVPWGFRLVGGADFDIPLTVVKVTEGSIAEKSGMREGDIIVRINDVTASNISHDEAHKIIIHCGNTFFLGVMRQVENNEETDDTLLEDRTEINSNCSELKVSTSSQDLHTDLYLETEYNEQTEENTTNISEENALEEEIAEIMSGEAEVLPEYNVIGVNFNRIFPKPGICKSSAVLRQLNEEAIKTKRDIEKEKRKWTTFLQKPDRPIPKSKQEIEAEACRETYKVRIVKQPKPKVAPGRTPTPPPELEPEPEPVHVLESEPDQIQDKQDEFVNNEQREEVLVENEIEILESNNEEKVYSDLTQYYNEMQWYDDTSNGKKSVEKEVDIVEPKVPEKTEEELLLEQQLADVQKQLLALSSLPSTIQATLDSVTKQLGELLPNFKLITTEKDQPEENLNIAMHNFDELQEDENNKNINCQNQQLENELENEERVLSNDEIRSMEEVRNLFIQEMWIQGNLIPEETIEEITAEKHNIDDINNVKEIVESKNEEEIIEEKELLEQDHQQRLLREKIPKRPPKAFGPLTPQERPLFLPGGRKWRTPKDAFNEEFIAEVISSQAELIVGTTLGSSFESPRLGYDERVNFLKYQKPEKKIDLDKSEVYKFIHDMDRKPMRGIDARPEKVIAEADVKRI